MFIMCRVTWYQQCCFRWMQACLQIANKLEKEQAEGDGETTPAEPPAAPEGEEAEEEEEELPPASELEEALRNGVLLARIALWFAPENVSKRHTYDLQEKVYKVLLIKSPVLFN